MPGTCPEPDSRHTHVGERDPGFSPQGGPVGGGEGQPSKPSSRPYSGNNRESSAPRLPQVHQDQAPASRDLPSAHTTWAVSLRVCARPQGSLGQTLRLHSPGGQAQHAQVISVASSQARVGVHQTGCWEPEPRGVVPGDGG